MVKKRKRKTVCIFHFCLLRQVFPRRARLAAGVTCVVSSLQPEAHGPPQRGAGCRSHAGSSSASGPLWGQSHKGLAPLEHVGQGQGLPSKEGPPHIHLERQTGRADPTPARLLSVPYFRRRTGCQERERPVCQAGGWPEGGSTELTRSDPLL